MSVRTQNNFMSSLIEKMALAVTQSWHNMYVIYTVVYTSNDLSFASTETKYIKLKPKMILLFLEFFIKNDIIILAFFKQFD